MGTEKNRRWALEAEQLDSTALQNGDLEPKEQETDKVRGGILPPDGIASAPLEPPNDIRSV